MSKTPASSTVTAPYLVFGKPDIRQEEIDEVLDSLERAWLGRDGVSVSQASGTGLMSQDSCEWDTGLMEACHIDDRHVSPIVDLDHEVDLSPRLKRRWPSLAGARWIPAEARSRRRPGRWSAVRA